MLVVPLCAGSLIAQHVQGAQRLLAFRSESELLQFFRPVPGQPDGRPRSALTTPCTSQPVAAIDSAVRGSGNAIIQGRISDARGSSHLINGAMLSAPGLGFGAVTNGTGQASFAIPADSLRKRRAVIITARTIGFQPQSVLLRVRPGDRVTVRFALCASPLELNAVVVSGAASDAITNTQSDGVDEGGIVKRRGDVLVILRRGRLFTVGLSQKGLRPIATVNAYGPGIDPSGTWYDEMLIADDRVVVIGYSYQRGGTEIGVFKLGRDGSLRYLDTYQLSGDDYYSSDNYAARLIGSELIVYSPVPVWRARAVVDIGLPTLRRWHHRGRSARDTATFRQIVTARQVFRAPQASGDDAFPSTLHSVIRCNLRLTPLSCSTTSVLGGPGNVFYVSPTAVHVAAVSWRSRAESATTIFRIPLSGADPTAIRVNGSPINQFSFDERHGSLRMLLQQRGWGDGMSNGDGRAGALAVVSVPLTEFADAAIAVPRDRYVAVPTPSVGYSIENRFIGDALLYGGGTAWRRPENVRDAVYVIRMGERATSTLPIDHAVDRIEAMGANAVLVGAGASDLTFSAVNLEAVPRISHTFTLPGASQGETRSHGFFYRPDLAGGSTGVLGLPVAGAGRAGVAQLWSGSEAVLFLRNTGSEFTPIGALSATATAQADDCRASCTDWYGNARPLFLDDRLVALLGYELVEGSLANDRLTEAARVSFAPGRQAKRR